MLYFPKGSLNKRHACIKMMINTKKKKVNFNWFSDDLYNVRLYTQCTRYELMSSFQPIMPTLGTLTQLLAVYEYTSHFYGSTNMMIIAPCLFSIF